MLNNIYLITAIAIGCFTLTSMTITAFMWINNSFRKYLEELLNRHDKENKAWTKQLFLDYYITLDERIKNVNIRLKNIEKICEKNHD